MPNRYLSPDDVEARERALHRGTVLDEDHEDDNERGDRLRDERRDSRPEADDE